MFSFLSLRLGRRAVSLLCVVAGSCGTTWLPAADYFLTIGGGYSRSGNQASLEANVVFYQQLLVERHRGEKRHDIFFADGDDPAADLQITAEKSATSESPATELLAALHRRRGGAEVDYRNHRVADLAGPLEPKLVRAALESVAEKAGAGDRLIVYVTAHGSEGPKDDPFNTTIDCWNNRKITAREFTKWLDKLPAEMPVVMVMAQCYCGGFGHTIFAELKEDQGLATQPRAGFFAQRHDLPAAGCRPDIEHDEEFSSYFWGALAGRTRNGVPITGCDVDGNGVISFAEAYAHAVIAGETIDIPQRTSEVFLRTFSRLTPEKSDDAETEDGAKPALQTVTGSLESLLDGGRPVAKRIVTELAKTLGFTLQDNVTAVTAGLEDSRRGNRPSGRGRGRSSGRRDLLKEVTEKWPELGDERKWQESSLLKAENQETLLAELKELPSWKVYDERRQQSDAADKAADQRELRMIKFRRLLQTLEAIVLEKNLPLIATPAMIERYGKLVALEESALNAGEN